MNKKYIFLGIIGASAVAIYLINRRFSTVGTKNGQNVGSSGKGIIQNIGNVINSVVKGKKTLPMPEGGLVKQQECPVGYSLFAIDPTKPKDKICVPTPKQDTRVPVKCPSWMTLKDGVCVAKTTDGEIGGGGFSGNPPKERDERPPTNQSEYTDAESTLVFDDNSSNRY